MTGDRGNRLASLGRNTEFAEPRLELVGPNHVALRVEMQAIAVMKRRIEVAEVVRERCCGIDETVAATLTLGPEIGIDRPNSLVRSSKPIGTHRLIDGQNR